MPVTPEDGESDFYVIPADTPEDIQAKLLRVVTEHAPALWFPPDPGYPGAHAHEPGSLGARALNEVLQAALNPEATPRVTKFGWTYAPGDKVIQTLNDYDKMSLTVISATSCGWTWRRDGGDRLRWPRGHV